MTTRIILENIGKDYFKAFESKDISVLSSMFDESVQLTDPFIQTVSGKDNVLAANADTFRDISVIKFAKCEIFVDKKYNTIIGELEIWLDENKLEVVDIIHVNEDLLITSIIAYINPIKD